MVSLSEWFYTSKGVWVKMVSINDLWCSLAITSSEIKTCTKNKSMDKLISTKMESVRLNLVDSLEEALRTEKDLGIQDLKDK